MEMDRCTFDKCVILAYFTLQKTIKPFGEALTDFWANHYLYCCVAERRENFVEELVCCSAKPRSHGTRCN